MKEEIRAIMWNFVAGEVTDSEAAQQVLDLFNVKKTSKDMTTITLPAIFVDAMAEIDESERTHVMGLLMNYWIYEELPPGDTDGLVMSIFHLCKNMSIGFEKNT
jgi:hypothetical protein